MGAWVRVAEFTKAKHLKGGLVARSVAGLPFLLEEGLFCAFVPPVIDVPRQGTVVEVRPEARGGATVFFDTVVDANQADALVGCYVLARREDLPDDVLELQEGGIEGFTVVDAEAGIIGTAVAINENDPRYAHLHGCHVILPLMNIEIPIVCDEHADMEKGTGVVKITPAHDPNDFEVGQRHNLPIVRVFTYDGRMTGAKEKAENDALFASGKATVGEPRVIDCGKYAGMTTMEARKAIVKDLEAGGYLKRVEPLAHEVGTCYRCHTTIEPMVSKQWFVKMAPLAKPAVECVRSGEVRFVPERFAKNYMTWMENIRDWCISRQLWWGHRIPAWYCDDCGEVIVARETPTVCPKCGCTHLTQDEDVLDTWFSSALWPFSTLGWPEQTADLSYFYPTSVLVTGCAIIFWPLSFVLPNALRAANDVKFTMVVSILSMACWRLGFSYLLCVRMGWGAVGVWVAMVIDWTCRVTCFVLRFRSGAWKTKYQA
mgnify:CR=1 FL=1